MKQQTASEGFLVVIPTRKKDGKASVSTTVSTTSFLGLIPSQVVSSRQDSTVSFVASTNDDTNALSPRGNSTKGVHSSRKGRNSGSAPISSAILEGGKRRQRRRRRRRQIQNESIGSSTENNTRNTTSKISNQRRRKKRTGMLPDIYWRTIPMDHLRKHPNFVPLPPLPPFEKLETLEDVRHFRQESWQWDALHLGRCTTSQAVAALGLLEPKAGKALGVPLSLRRGARGAYERLRKRPIRTLEEMNREFFDVSSMAPEPKQEDDTFLWDVENITDTYPFVARYLMKDTKEDIRRRRKVAERFSGNSNSMIMSVRMNWGNTQEPMAVLTALNYFCKKEPQIKLKEVGMCGAGLSINSTSDGWDSKLLVGATPDALITWPDGTVEALEVKNHCPFMPERWSERSNPKGQYCIRNLPFTKNLSIQPVYLPQLMMEMMCVGSECKAAVMVRQTALSGAVILRLKRNDEWIKEMLFWLDKFQSSYVIPGKPPPVNIFWEDDDEKSVERYKRFVEKTKKLAASVEVLDHVQYRDIQRVVSDTGGEIPLFLD